MFIDVYSSFIHLLAHRLYYEALLICIYCDKASVYWVDHTDVVSYPEDAEQCKLLQHACSFAAPMQTQH